MQETLLARRRVTVDTMVESLYPRTQLISEALTISGLEGPEADDLNITRRMRLGRLCLERRRLPEISSE